MVVALAAALGEAEPGGGGGVDAIDEGFKAVFLAGDAGFAIDEGVAMEAGSDALLQGGMGSRSPASCSMVNWLKGLSWLKLWMT